MRIKFTKGVKGPLNVGNGTYYKKFEGHAPFDVEDKEWPRLQKVRVPAPPGMKDADGKPVRVVEAFEMLDGPAETTRPAAAKPAPGRPVAVDAAPAADPKGGK